MKFNQNTMDEAFVRKTILYTGKQIYLSLYETVILQ